MADINIVTTTLAKLDDDVTFDSVQLNGGTGTQGTMSWNTDEETVDLIQNGATLQIGQEVQYHVRNSTPSDIANGSPVMVTGTLGTSGRITIGLMNGTDDANAKLYLGIATEDIASGTDGKVTFFGKVRGLDTSSYSEGDILYISTSTAGALTNVAPTSGLKMAVAFVINSHATNGTLAVRTNNLDENRLLTDAQISLIASALQEEDNISLLVNDVGYITSAPVDSVAGKTGAVTLVKADITDFSDVDYATAAQGALADSAIQSGDNVSELTNDAGYLTSSSTITDYISGLIEAPSDKDYKLVVKSPYACTITETTTISTAGTATATFKINTTALGGTANSVSSTEESQTHSSSNSVSAGDDIVLTISSTSSCENLSFTIKFTRSLA